MRKSTLVGGLAVALASMVLVLPPPASAAPGGGSGEVFSDLFVALRDEDGVPILSETFYEEGPVEVTCIQPISYTAIPGITSTTNPADGREVYLVPLVGEDFTEPPPAPLAAADTACSPKTEFLAYASEVDLERLNLVRTSDEVLWKKLVEIRARLEAATEISLDGAGRITTDGVPIDASPEHAAMYAAAAPSAVPLEGGPAETDKLGGLMDTGSIPGLAGYPAVPASIQQNGDGFDQWMLAAAAVGTAAGKSVPITIDTIAYYNRTAAPDGLVSRLGLRLGVHPPPGGQR